MLGAKFNISIEEKTISYLISNYGQEAQKWIEDIESIVELLSNKWHLSILGSEPNARFGCILYGKSDIYGDIVLKLVPPCCIRLGQEILCYKKLSYSNMVTLYDYDLSLGGFLLRRIFNRPIESLESVSVLFETMYSQRQEVQWDSDRYSYELAFHASLSNAKAIILKRSDNKLEEFLPAIEKALFYYRKIEKKKLFFIHGDAHIHNILRDSQNTYLIDPIGYMAPFEVEYARFIGTYIRENEAYNLLSAIIQKVVCGKCDSRQVLSAIGFDVTMRACNTFCEGNTYEEILDALAWTKRTWNAIESLAL